jgi:hypothetical protein
LANEARRLSREKYGRRVSEVEKEITERRSTGQSAKKTPKVNPREWR